MRYADGVLLPHEHRHNLDGLHDGPRGWTRPASSWAVVVKRMEGEPG
jgi:hypothetical protein